MKSKINILLTSVGRRTYIVSYFKDALNGIGQVHAANSEESYSMRIADKSILTPLIYDERYINFLLSYCIENNIKAIIPLFDIDLPILAKNKSKFSDYGIQVVVSDFETTQICNDKWMTYYFLRKNGFATPASYLRMDDCKKAFEIQDIHFPVITKPRWGMGSIGIFQADNMKELSVFYERTKKSIFDSYLKYESLNDLENSVIIQEKLLGVEFGLDIFNDLKGNFLTCVPKKKLAMRAGETDSAEIVDNAELLKLGKSLAQKLKHIGNLDVDCISIGDSYFVFDLNCRFGGQYPFSHLAGANFPKAIINMLKGDNVDNILLSAKVGIKGFKDLTPVKLD